MTPISSLNPSNRSLRAHFPVSNSHPPQPRKEKQETKAKPIKTLDEFKAVHLETGDKIARYAESKRADYAKLAPWVARDMGLQMACYCSAINLYSRIKLAELLLDHLRDEPAIEAGPLYFVTVVSCDFVVPIKDAVAMSPEKLHSLVYRLQQLTRQALQGVPFIGMVEPGVYKGWGPNGPNPNVDSISWHTHVIAWGVDEKRIKAARKLLGSRHVNISGGRPLHWKSIGFDELDVHALYLAKAPLKEYRLNAKVGDKYDTETGEVFVKLRQQKRDIRRREQVQALNAMRHLNLDDLLFAGATGRPIVKAMMDKALSVARMREECAEVCRTRAAGGGLQSGKIDRGLRRQDIVPRSNAEDMTLVSQPDHRKSLKAILHLGAIGF